MARAKNTADEKAVGEDFLIDLLKVTARPTQSILKAAASSVFAVSPETADAFAGRMCKSISYCRQKEKSAQSGEKLHSAVRKVILALRGKAGANEVSPASARASSPVEAPAMSSAQEASASSKKRSRSPPRTRESIFLELGLTPPKGSSKPLLVFSPAVSIDSSVQVASSQEGPLPSSEAASSSRQSNDKVAVYVDNSTLELVRAHAGKDAQRYPLEVGPEGFAVAKVDGATVPTEVPNLLLKKGPLPPTTGALKKPAAALKRPAAAPSMPEAGERAAEHSNSEGSEPHRKNEYSKMFYKASGAFAIRQKFFAKSQIFQLKSHTLSKDQVSDIADQAVARLHAGQSEDQVKQWARSQM